MVTILCHFKTPLSRTFQLRATGNSNMAESQTCEMGAAPESLSSGSRNGVCPGKYAVFKVFYYNYNLKYEYHWNAEIFGFHFNGDI
jgi:hypothetical protein